MPPSTTAADRPLEHGSSRLARLLPRSRLLRVAVPVQLGWAAEMLRSAPASALRHDLRLVGLALLIVDLIGCGVTRWRPLARSVSAASATDRPAVAAVEISPRSAIAPAERHQWAVGALALLASRTAAGSGSEVPLQLLRVGEHGVELLLGEALEQTPEGFRAGAEGLVLLLDPALDLEDLPAGQPGLPSLLELGRDEEGTYFAPGDEAPYCDDPRQWELPGGLQLIEGAAGLVLEPFALRLRPSAGREHVGPESAGQPSTADDSTGAPAAPPTAASVLLVTDDAVLEEETASPGFTTPATVEVRILRETPDVVGGLVAKASPAAVDFLAYLVTHGHRASPAKLRDALVVNGGPLSRAGKTIWTAASGARRAVGEDRLPVASGTGLYTLSEEVGCDWSRFQELRARARVAGDEPARRRDALVEALTLVEGVPGLGSRRFTWLDTDGLLREITLAVLESARLLAALALEDGDTALATWAIAKGKLLLPNDGELVAIEARLAEGSRPSLVSE